MKNLYLLFLTIFSLTTIGCSDGINHHFDDTPPSEPQNIYLINGDNRVDLAWDRNRESDLAGYNIYFSDRYDGRYEIIGSSRNEFYTDFDAVNGVKTYYAITAYDFDGNESELSRDVIYATPRPEGFGESIFDYRRFPNNSGYYFKGFEVRPYDDNLSDFFFENFEGTFYLNVWDDSDIIDMGRTSDIYDIPYAPTSGWSETKDVIARVGNTYVIWTWDNHYAKIRVSSITRDRIVFDWAYQTVDGVRQLKPSVKNPSERKMDKSRLRIGRTSE